MKDMMEQSLPAVSVVIPVYQSAATLGPLVDRLLPVLAASFPAHELILVNDGSSDGSWERIIELSRERESVRGLDLLRNHGQHNALLCGIRSARHPVIVTMDDDLQNPPEEVPRLVERLGPGVDVVYGLPRQERHGLLRDFASRSTKWVMERFMGAEVPSGVSAFRAFRTDLRRAFRDYRGPFVSIDVLLTWGARRFTSVVVEHESRQVGRSHYSFRKLVNHAFNMITGFSVVPLQMASWIGFAFTALGLLVLVYVIGAYLIVGVEVQGFAFLASAVAIFSGAQLFALGIVGEYLARMHFRLMDRPCYTVRDSTEPGAGELA
jgi:glycosyltransferase involved in cell wall biosynthesis